LAFEINLKMIALTELVDTIKVMSLKLIRWDWTGGKTWDWLL